MCVGLATCHTEEKEVLLVAKLSKAVGTNLRGVNTPTKIPDTLAKHMYIYVRKLMNRYEGQGSIFCDGGAGNICDHGASGSKTLDEGRSALLI